MQEGVSTRGNVWWMGKSDIIKADKAERTSVWWNSLWRSNEFHLKLAN